jgi:hypothetical protein
MTAELARIMRNEQPLYFASPLPKRTRRPFLARPFWRDGIVAYVLIGTGFIVSGPGWVPWLGYIMMGLGGGIVLAAPAHASWERARRR